MVVDQFDFKWYYIVIHGLTKLCVRVSNNSHPIVPGLFWEVHANSKRSFNFPSFFIRRTRKTLTEFTQWRWFDRIVIYEQTYTYLFKIANVTFIFFHNSKSIKWRNTMLKIFYYVLYKFKKTEVDRFWKPSNILGHILWSVPCWYSAINLASFFIKMSTRLLVIFRTILDSFLKYVYI